jgi:hypothetical protein
MPRTASPASNKPTAVWKAEDGRSEASEGTAVVDVKEEGKTREGGKPPGGTEAEKVRRGTVSAVRVNAPPCRDQ